LDPFKSPPLWVKVAPVEILLKRRTLTKIVTLSSQTAGLRPKHANGQRADIDYIKFYTEKKMCMASECPFGANKLGFDRPQVKACMVLRRGNHLSQKTCSRYIYMPGENIINE
jgi:hypothetical protein